MQGSPSTTQRASGVERRRRWWQRPPALVRVLSIGVALLAFGHLINVLVGHDIELLRHQLGLDNELNVSTWYASMLWAIAGAIMAIWAVLMARREPGMERWALFMPAAGLLVMSMDEVAGLHEAIGTRLDSMLPGGSREGTALANTGIWMLIILPIAVVAAAWIGYVLRAHLRAVPRATWLFVAAGLLFVLGAGGVELATNAFVRDSTGYDAIVLVEELFEMLAALAAIWAAWELLRGTTTADDLTVSTHRRSKPG